MDFSEQLDKNGYTILSEHFNELLNADFLSKIEDELSITSNRKSGGIRFPEKKSKTIATFISSNQITSILRRMLSPQAKLIRSILFDKNTNANWGVDWHQDTTIAVKEKFEIKGYKPWSLKDGIPHVKPPNHVLEKILTLRIHLDDTGETNGCLNVVPQSHREGKLTDKEIREKVQSLGSAPCLCLAGSILIMRPLLIHSSARSISGKRRRVLHLEYTDQDLPEGLEWL